MSLDLKNKKVTIIGAARSGIAVLEVVLRLGGIGKISDNNSLERFKGQLEVISQGIDPARLKIEASGHTQAFIEDSDLIVISPGVRLDAKPLEWARARGIEVIGEIEFAFRLCPCPIIAVTGSNGKTTTSVVIAEILKAAGRSVYLCGNIGSPFSAYVLDLQKTDIVVLEISSFQLESTTTFKPKIALWTNFSQNHLDRHKDLEEYFEAKCKIFANQDSSDFAVLNALDPRHPSLGKKVKAKVVFFNTLDQPVGVDNPNYLAAIEAVKILGISQEQCLAVFAGFKGVEHRLEFVRDINGIAYINDSKSTTVEAGRWALERAQKPVVMICGGLDKHLDYTVLVELVKVKVRVMLAIGQAKEIMQAVFGAHIPVVVCHSLEEAVRQATVLGKGGEQVLFSPMCASFDMFKDYEHRGQCFKEIVNNL